MSLIDRYIADGKAILLFYQEAECDTFFRNDRYLKRAVRPLYNQLLQRRKKTGFRVSFDLLKEALQQQQRWLVRVNDYATARKYPDYPVGLVGYPVLLERWKLPNPAVLGSALYDHPKQAPRLLEDRRFRRYLVPSQWPYDMFHPYYGDACAQWFAGIDTAQWPDISAKPKSVDFLIYDKIRWDHSHHERALLQPIRELLQRRGFRIEVIRYNHHDHAAYRALLERSRAMIFLCEHESQGLAYQEAMASNVPVLAWDPGVWVDPLAKQLGVPGIAASSVPYFSADCGERFVDWPGFEPALERFIDRLPRLRPRDYVRENLSMKRSAEIYAGHYFSLLSAAQPRVNAA